MRHLEGVEISGVLHEISRSGGDIRSYSMRYMELMEKSGLLHEISGGGGDIRIAP
jgi:hypothetical protein